MYFNVMIIIQLVVWPKEFPLMYPRVEILQTCTNEEEVLSLKILEIRVRSVNYSREMTVASSTPVNILKIRILCQPGHP